jgi:hypothetical protein
VLDCHTQNKTASGGAVLDYTTGAKKSKGNFLQLPAEFPAEFLADISPISFQIGVDKIRIKGKITSAC